MKTKLRRVGALLALLAATSAFAQSSPPPTAEQMVAAQRSAMAKLPPMDGIWRGPGWMNEGQGRRQMTVTYRVGPFLDNTVKVIEIKGYLADGSVGFHAFNVISFDSEEKKEYVINARAGGRSGAFSFKLAPGGFIWNIGAADSGLRYTATFKDGTWTEKGESLAPGRPATTVSEFTLRRIGDTNWPEAGAVPPR